jgi:hypothetical protein
VKPYDVEGTAAVGIRTGSGRRCSHRLYRFLPSILDCTPTTIPRIAVGNQQPASRKRCSGAPLFPYSNSRFPCWAGRPYAPILSVRLAAFSVSLAETRSSRRSFRRLARVVSWRGVYNGSLRDVRRDPARGNGPSDRASNLRRAVRSRRSDLRGDHDVGELEEEASDVQSRGAIRQSEGESRDGCCVGALARIIAQPTRNLGSSYER